MTTFAYRQPRNSITPRNQAKSFKSLTAGLAAVLALAFASNAGAALTGTYDAASSQTGGVTISAPAPAGPYTIPAGPFFCVGPNGDNCVSSGMSMAYTMSGTQVFVNFSGSTFSSSGTFKVTLSNFSATILSATYNSGSLITGGFSLTSVGAHTLEFTGSATGGGFNAIGGRTIIFDVVTGDAPVISKAFGAPTIPLGGTTSVTITIKNPNASTAISGVAFTDTLPAGLAFASPSALAQTCGGVAVAATGPPAVLSLSGGTIPGGSSCTVSANVTGITAGTEVNSVTVNFFNGGTGNTATATLVVVPPPTFSKAFSPSAITLGGVSTLTFTITNNYSAAVTGLAFTDTLPAGVVPASPVGGTSNCGGVVTAAGDSISLTGGAVSGPAGTSCTISVNVNGLTDGTKVNTTSNLTSANAGTAGPATATLTVGIPPYWIRYSSNLTEGDSVINITNTGVNGNSLNGPGFGTPAGNICVNVYAFSPDEQLISCCSCLVTPNGLVHLTANNDLVSNTLTGIRPNSIVIKMVATGTGPGPTFSGSSCANSAALAGSAAFPIANGMMAFGTTLHSASSTDPNPAGPFSITETPFLPATLSLDELSSVRSRCTNIIGNGSTFGICRSCRLGGLGGEKQ